MGTEQGDSLAYLYGGQIENVKKSRIALITSAPVPKFYVQDGELT